MAGLDAIPAMHSLFGLELRDGDPEPFARNGTGAAPAPLNRGAAAKAA